MNEHIYVSNVLYFALCRVQKSDFNSIKEFMIIFDNCDYDMDIAKNFILKKVGFNIDLKYIDF